jgi:hypothetical protein
MSYCENFRIDGKRINELEIKEGESVKFETFYYEDKDSNSKRIVFSSKRFPHIVLKKDGIYKVTRQNGRSFREYVFNQQGVLIRDGNSIYVNKSGIVLVKQQSNNKCSMIKNKEFREIFDGDGFHITTMYNSGYRIRKYDFSDMKLEYHSKCNDITETWNPKDLGLYIPRIMKYIFLHIYFLLKTILNSKINNKDLRQYIFRFLFDLN